jgi:hypothetical protein
MVGCREDQRRVRGLERIGGISKAGRPSLSRYVTLPEKGIAQPPDKDRHDQGDK